VANSIRLIAVLVICLALSLPAFAQTAEAPNPFQQLHFRHLGPIGNRTAAIVSEPGNPLVIYVGASAGGIFKTEDGGNTWRPIFDQQDVAAIGALALAPSQPNVVWAGTGETFIIRPFYPLGDGIYKSTDSGRNWQHMGLEETGHIGRIIVDPRDPNVVFACAVGQGYRSQRERGIFRTKDGGKTWEHVLLVNENTGCSDLAMDAHDPQTLFAGMWQVDIKTWNLNSGGTGSGVYVTHDGGTTWKRVAGNGLPAADHPLGKIAVAISPSNSNRVYALVQDTTPGLYRSDDGGRSWRLVNQSHVIAERAPYYTRVSVSPDDPNLLYFPCVSWNVSRDGGTTLATDIVRAGGDNHDVWIDPFNPKRILVAHDQGISVSLNGGQTYEHLWLPIAQVYHVYTDTRIPYNVFGNRQDGPSYYAPNRTLGGGGGGGLGGGGIAAGEWRSYGGCESGFGVPDPQDPDIVWSGCYDGGLDRTNLRTGQARSVHVWPDATYGWAPADVKYRWHWTFPIAISPFDHSKVYVGSQYVHMTTNGGQSWSVISPDLTTNDKSHQQNSGGISWDNLMTWDGAVLYAIAESPKQAGVIWTGSNDGQVNITRDGGKNWTNVTKNIPGLPPWGTVMNVQPSNFEAGTAYIAVDLQQVGDYNAYVYKTADYGANWKPISASVPKSVNSNAKVVVEDPVRQGMLYLGTNNGLYLSWDDGSKWTRLRNNLPPAPVYWITIEPRFHDLLVATHGRGIYDLDDITPLRNWDKAAAADVQLFPARPAYRFRNTATARANEAGHVNGENPPYGADINFSLKAAAPWTVIILDAENKAVRTLRGRGVPGLNRIWWDLRHEGPDQVRLLTPPPDAPWVQNGPEGWRPLVAWGAGMGGGGAVPAGEAPPGAPPAGGRGGGGGNGPRVVPGRYGVRLTVGEDSFTQPLEVLRDPDSLGSEADARAQTAFLLQMRDEITEAATLINHVERTRRQLEDLPRILGSNPKSLPVLKAARELEAKAVEVEGLLVDVHLTGPTEDSFRHPMMVYEKLRNLFSAADGGADLPPTDQQVAVNKELAQKIAEAREKVKVLADREMAAFNQLLKSSGFNLAVEP